MSKNNRRDFIKKMGVATSLSTLCWYSLPFSFKQVHAAPSLFSKRVKVSIYQTTDLHCQVHQHDELSWENNQVVCRKTGGYAYLKTLFDKLKKEKPIDTMILNTLA